MVCGCCKTNATWEVWGFRRTLSVEIMKGIKKGRKWKLDYSNVQGHHEIKILIRLDLKNTWQSAKKVINLTYFYVSIT